MIINLSKAKAKLSKLVDMAYQGEEIIIAKNNLPLVKLVAHKPKEKRRLSLLAGQIHEDLKFRAKFQEEFFIDHRHLFCGRAALPSMK